MTPIGIFSGPIAMAEMLSDVITWNGPINYIVGWWGEHVSEPVHNVLSWLSGIFYITLPGWFKYVSDYIILSSLLYTSYLRADALLGRKIRYNMINDIPDFLIWPVLAFLNIGIVFFNFISWIFGKPFQAQNEILNTAPFLIFLLLFLANTLYK
jgi:hypothetical protein